jgi:phage baseplate assembly protein gpV
MKDTVRIGIISTIDYKKGMAKITYPDRDDDVTAQLPFLASEYMMPSVGDSVLVLHLSNDISDGVIIGRMYNDDLLPEKYGKNVYYKALDSKSSISSESGALKISADAITFTGSAGSITLSEIISHIKGA